MWPSGVLAPHRCKEEAQERGLGKRCSLVKLKAREGPASPTKPARDPLDLCPALGPSSLPEDRSGDSDPPLRCCEPGPIEGQLLLGLASPEGQCGDSKPRDESCPLSEDRGTERGSGGTVICHMWVCGSPFRSILGKRSIMSRASFGDDHTGHY